MTTDNIDQQAMERITTMRKNCRRARFYSLITIACAFFVVGIALNKEISVFEYGAIIVTTLAALASFSCAVFSHRLLWKCEREWACGCKPPVVADAHGLAVKAWQKQRAYLIVLYGFFSAHLTVRSRPLFSRFRQILQYSAPWMRICLLACVLCLVGTAWNWMVNPSWFKLGALLLILLLLQLCFSQIKVYADLTFEAHLRDVRLAQKAGWFDETGSKDRTDD